MSKFKEDLFFEEEIAGKVSLSIGILTDAQTEPDIEDRFVRARMAANSLGNDPEQWFAFCQL